MRKVIYFFSFISHTGEMIIFIKIELLVSLN